MADHALGDSAAGRVAPGTGTFLITRVADTTAQRDRDALDRSIVELLQEFLTARSIGLYRIVDGAGERRLVPRASSGTAGEEGAPSLRSAAAACQQCITTQTWVQTQLADGRFGCLFPIE